jgi:hypothetical protein
LVHGVVLPWVRAGRPYEQPAFRERETQLLDELFELLLLELLDQ